MSGRRLAPLRFNGAMTFRSWRELAGRKDSKGKVILLQWGHDLPVMESQQIQGGATCHQLASMGP